MKNKYDREKARHAKRLRRVEASEASLPHNRLAVFWDCFKLRWDLLLKMGGILLLFALPFMAVMVFSKIYQVSLLSALYEGSITAEQYQGAGFYLTIITVAAEAVGLIIISIALSGFARVIKRLVFYEPIQFKTDFLLGIKENIKSYLALGTTFAFIYFFAFVMLKMTNFAGEIDMMSKVAYYIPFVLTVILFAPAFVLVFTQVSIYKNTFGGYIKNGFILYLKKPFFIILGINIIVVPIYFLLGTNMYVTLILGGCYFLVVLPIAFLVAHIYSCYVFDVYINKEQYPEIYDKGIYRKTNKNQQIIDINENNERGNE